MIQLTIEGKIKQVGNTLQMDKQEMQVETIEQALAVIERQLGRKIEDWDAVIVLENTVWAAI